MNAYLILCCLAVVIKGVTSIECGTDVGKRILKRCYSWKCNHMRYGRGGGRIPDKKPCAEGERDDGTSCWLDSYGRGAGRMPDKAPCPSGLRDDGTSCWKDAHIYGKCCCTKWGCCGCPSGYHDDGCTCRRTDVGIKVTLFDRQSCKAHEDKYGALCYPKCKTGYHSVGCCICQPPGGPKITKTALDRYACRSNEELYGSLCYPKCKEGYVTRGCCMCQPLHYGCPDGSIYLNKVCVHVDSCSEEVRTKYLRLQQKIRREMNADYNDYSM